MYSTGPAALLGESGGRSDIRPPTKTKIRLLCRSLAARLVRRELRRSVVVGREVDRGQDEPCLDAHAGQVRSARSNSCGLRARPLHRRRARAVPRSASLVSALSRGAIRRIL